MDDGQLDERILLLWHLYDPDLWGPAVDGQQASVRATRPAEFVEHAARFVLDHWVHENCT